MPIYEGDEYPYEQLSALRKRNVCAVCGERLDLYQNWGDNKAFIACKDWLRTHHEGIEREASRWEKEGMASLNIESRREKMEQEHGTKMTTALEAARVPMTGALTQPQAMTILKLVYPNVPEPEIIRTAILCRDFGLHPLMKEVYIIPFKNKQTGKTNWSTVLGIGATRKLVAQRGTYSYIGNTPRVMREQEQMDIFGKVSNTDIIAITKLKTRGGMEAQGYGRISKTGTFQGEDKGNTRENMAFIRSERNAFGRLFTDALPQGIEVIDEAYADVPDVGKVSTATGEVIEGGATELPPVSRNYDEPPTNPESAAYGVREHFCQEHNCDYEKKVRGSSVWYAHNLPDGKWCNEVKKKEKKADTPPPEQTPLPEQEPQGKTEDDPEGLFNESPPEPEPGTLEALKLTMDECNWSGPDVKEFCNTERGWNINDPKDLGPEQIIEIVAHIKNNPK